MPHYKKHKTNQSTVKKQIDLEYLKKYRDNSKCSKFKNIYRLKSDTNKCQDCNCEIYLGYFRHFNFELKDSYKEIEILPKQTMTIFGQGVLSTYGGHALYFDPLNLLIACGQCWSRRLYTAHPLEQNTICGISHDQIYENDQYMKCSKCNAPFFVVCLKKWFETNTAKPCPNCRTPWTDHRIYTNLSPLPT